MGSKANPFNLHTITPYLVVDDVVSLISFLEAVFGGKLRGDIRHREDGSVQHTEISIGDSVIMMGEPMGDIKTTTSGLYVYVDDCDRVYKKAIKLGAIAVSEPSDYPHGDRYGGVRDAAGNIWWMVTHVGEKQQE